jgi:hypothetical protein
VQYNAYNDFSSDNNPNKPWEFGYTGALDGSVTAFSQATTLGSVTSWNVPGSTTLGSVARNLSTDTLEFQPGTFGGLGQYTVIEWTAPGSGTVSVQAAFTLIASASETVYMTENIDNVFRQLFSSSISGGSSNDLAVAAGDTIDFSIEGSANSDNDSAAVSVDITYSSCVPEPSTLLIWSALAIVGLAIARRGRQSA